MHLRPVAVDHSGQIPGGVGVGADVHAEARRLVRTDGGITPPSAGDMLARLIARATLSIRVRQFAAH